MLHLLRMVSFSLGLMALSAAQAAPVKVTEVEGVSEYRLDNGLRVLLAPDQAKPVVTLNIVYMVGSRHESNGETGMAHLLEHLLFKGTPTHSNIPQELSKRGMRANGTTSFDRTNYFETFTASDENLDWALKLEADRMVNSFIARKDLDSEMTVVRNEMESGENNPGYILGSKMRAAAFQWHSYGKSPIGARSDVENVRIENLQAFYRKYYQPDNAMLVVAGRFDPTRTLGKIEQLYGVLPKPNRSLAPTWTVEPAQEGERSVQLRRVGETRLLSVIYHAPASAHSDNMALDILSDVLGDTPNGRLYKALVEPRLATSSYGGQMSLREGSLLSFGAELRKEDDPAKVRQALLGTLEGIANQPITQAELDRARQAALANYEKALSDPNSLALTLGNAQSQGDWRLLFWERDQLEKLTLAEVNRVAQFYLRADNRTLGEFVPLAKAERTEIPAAPDLTAALKGYQGRAAAEQGEVFDPTVANLEARTQRQTLAGGLQIALLPKKNKGQRVQMQMALALGNQENLRKQATVFYLTSDMLIRGTMRHSRSQLAAELDRLKTTLSIGASGQYVIVNIDTVHDHVPAVLALLKEILREPAFSPDEFAQLIQQNKAHIESARVEPQSISQNALLQHLNPYPQDDFRHVASFAEDLADLDRVKLDDIKAFHREFYGANHGQFAAVGDFDAAQVKTLLGQAFDDWKSQAAYLRLPENYQDAAPLVTQLATPDKQNAVLHAALRIPVGDTHPDYPALYVASQILGGGFLNSRLATRLRQKEGLSYTAYAYLATSSVADDGSLNAYAIYAPQNRDKLETALREELQRAVRDGFTASEVSEAQNAFSQNLLLARSSDAALASSLASQLQLQRDFSFMANIEKRIRALTPDAVNAALRRHIDPAKFSMVFAGNFASVK